jgi:4-amino-4-deoxy-L-arabinose transferase-like glycosyltransferase
MSRYRYLLLLFPALMLLGPLNADLIRNEGLRARLAAEAFLSDCWYIPTLDGHPHLTKPPGMGLLISLCSLPFGEVTPLTARLPSLLAAAITIFFFARVLGRLAGQRAAWLAVLILPATPLWFDRVPSAEIDLIQLAWITAAMLWAWEASEGDSWAWVWALLCVAGGFFTKWTAPLFFYLIVPIWLLCLSRGQQLLSRAHVLAMGVCLGLIVAWLGIVGQTVGWTEFSQTLGREGLLRFSPAHHPRPYPFDEWLTFPLSFLGGCLPWSVFLLPALHPRFVGSLDARQYRFWLLMQCWLWLSLLLWTLAPGHRPRHILPAQPAIAALAVLVWSRWLESVPSVRWRYSALATLLMLCLGAKLLFVGVILPARWEQRQPSRAGSIVAQWVSPCSPLFVWRIKDDGVLFHCRRQVRRIEQPSGLNSGAWCLLTAQEWEQWPSEIRVEHNATLVDGQGDILVLVRRP